MLFVPSLRTCFAAACSAAVLGAQAQVPPPGESVESLLELARDRNPEFAAMRHEAAAAGERTGPAGAFPDPMFRVELQDFTNEAAGGSASLLPARVGTTKYTVIQPLPFFGKRALRREVAESEALAASRGADATWLDLATKVKVAYAQYFYAAHNLRLAREVLDLVVRLESVAQARYSGGLAAQQDAIRAQVEQTELKTDIVGQESELARVKARLNAILARPSGAPLSEPRALRPLPQPARLEAAALESRARSRNPKVAAAMARANAAEKKVALTDRNRYPDFALGLSPMQMRNRISSWELMLEMNIPLQQGTRRAEEREARAMLEAARAKREATANDLAGELGENLAGLEAARRMEALAGTSLLPQAELTFDSALAGYENGKVDFATLLDAQRQIRRAKQERLKAQMEAQMRLAEIERIVGEDL